MLTIAQKKTAQAVVNIFETGSVLGDYGSVTLLAGDTGHLTYGRSQTTLRSGNLYELLKRYCDNLGARFSAVLAPFLPRFEARDISLDNEYHLHNILRAAADDPVMRETQDLFFDQKYWQRAENIARRYGITSPLGLTVVYDRIVHGSWDQMRNRTNEQFGDLDSRGEKPWITAYILIRGRWLSSHPRAVLRSTVYRMHALQRLVELDSWGLELPLVVREQEISQATLSGIPRGSYDGPQPGSRLLTRQTPLLKGLDVRLVQLGLSKSGIMVIADGLFGNATAAAIRSYQTARGLPGTGNADITLIAELAFGQ